METEYPTYKLGLSLKRAAWLVEWLRLLARTGKTEAKAFAQGLGCARLGTALLGTAMVVRGPGEAWRFDATDLVRLSGGSRLVGRDCKNRNRY